MEVPLELTFFLSDFQTAQVEQLLSRTSDLMASTPEVWELYATLQESQGQMDKVGRAMKGCCLELTKGSGFGLKTEASEVTGESRGCCDDG